VVVELLMIVVSLVASIAMSAFFFGTVGTVAHPALVSASTASCHSTEMNETCSVELVNVGSSATSTSAICTLGGAPGRVTSAGVIPAGGSKEVSCIVSGVGAPKGTSISGAIPLANGWSVYFSSRT